MQRDICVPGAALGGRGRGEFEEEAAAPFADGPVGGFEVGFAG